MAFLAVDTKNLFHQGSSHDQIEAFVPFVKNRSLGHRVHCTRLGIYHLPTLRAKHMDALQQLQHCIAVDEACLIVLSKRFQARRKNQAVRTKETAVEVGPSCSQAEPPSLGWELVQASYVMTQEAFLTRNPRPYIN